MRGLLIFSGLIFFLWLGRSIIVPLMVAAFLWYLINAIGAYYRKVMPPYTCALRSTKWACRISDWGARILALGTLAVVAYMFITQIQPMFYELAGALPQIQDKLIEFCEYVSGRVGIVFDASLMPNITEIGTRLGATAAGFATSIGMVVIYILFMFVEQSTFNKKFSAMITNRRQSRKIRYILDSIDDNMKKYLFMKTMISAATGIMSYIWLRAIGLEFAGVWAFIVFIMNYIPTIGSIIACALPILYALVVEQTLHTPILTAAGLICLQILLGNIIEPRLTGRTLNLSTLAILINLVFWGMIWGVAGMFFSVPLLVATFVITAQFDSTRPIAVLLSADGNIPDKRDDE